MMYLATLICFCLSAVTAVKHYGMMPPDDMYGMIEDHAQKLLENDMRLVSIFTTDIDHSTGPCASLCSLTQIPEC